MPQLGETVTEGTIIRWLKKVGDTVAQDEALFEVSTDKVDSEVPSPVAGVLNEILVEEGETVDVGARLAVVGAAGEAPAPPPPPPPPVEAAPPAPSASAPPAPSAPAPAAPPSGPADEVPAAPSVVPPQAPAAPAAPAAAPQPAYAAAAPASPNGNANNGNGTRGALLSPVVRRLISEHGLDPADIPGTGMGGRITREDVTGYIDTQVAAQVAAPPAPAPVVAAPAPAAPSYSPVPATAPQSATPPPVQVAPAVSAPAAPLGPRDEVVPFSGIRRVTAEHMVRSKATSAHTLVAVEADFENVDRVRKANREQFKAEEGVSLTYLPFVARAAVDVLREYPHLNSSVGDDALIVHRDVHLGIAVDLAKEGLIVPVLHNADGQSLRGLSRSIADLASRARSRKLSADDIAGGTFTITNPGPYGTFMTVPIIAQPQVAILSTDGVKRKPVVVTNADGDESIAIHSVGMLALSFDHRAVDGAYAASFMRDLATVIATRDWAAEL
jgi:pyruvate dehydrogenase E2 component (dihydrolipoamide acetyltransferase)